MIARPPMIDSTSPVNTFAPGTWPGRARLKLAAVVYHVAQGTFEGSLAWSKRAEAQSSFNFIVALDGRIAMRVAPWGGHAPWANGVADAAHTDLPAELAYLKAGAVNANWVTVSIEHEGHTDRPPYPTEAQYASTAWLVAWVMDMDGMGRERWRHQPHRAFDTASRPNCPGPRFSIDRVYREATARLVPPDVDAALEAAWLKARATVGEKRYAADLDRPYHRGKVLVCQRGIITPGGPLDPAGQVDDLVTYWQQAGVLTRH